jgi:protein-S-isoprenylcysteine O-methyltransferase Ste14
MVNVLNLIIAATVVVWVLIEVVMQVRQYRMGGHAERTEWRSLRVVGFGVAGGVAVGILAEHLLPGLRFPGDGTVALLVALPLMWVGIGFRLWAIHTLGRFFRGVVHVQADHEVVRDGPYRVLRHPSYTGALVAVTGLGLTFLNVASFVLYLACATAAVLYRIRVEESVLLHALGEDYRSYAEHTDRLVPHVW